MALSGLNNDTERWPRVALRERWAERGFSAADLLNLWAPLGAGERHEGLRYGSGPRQLLDVYRPRHARGAPLIVFFYGGSWQRGSRDLYPFLGASLAAQGIVTVVPDYALFPPARFPDFLQDSTRAVAFANLLNQPPPLVAAAPARCANKGPAMTFYLVELNQSLHFTRVASRGGCR